MDAIWKVVIKTTPVVGALAFLIWLFLSKIYSEQIETLFGGQKIFAITIFVLAGLFTCLLVAIKEFKRKKNESPQSASNKKAVFNNSTVNGDVVFGDKNTKSKK